MSFVSTILLIILPYSKPGNHEKNQVKYKLRGVPSFFWRGHAGSFSNKELAKGRFLGRHRYCIPGSGQSQENKIAILSTGYCEMDLGLISSFDMVPAFPVFITPIVRWTPGRI
jgi:hypothetical protein